MHQTIVIRAAFLLTVFGVFRVSAADVSGDRPVMYDVRTFGATGDGKTLDTPAINKAIESINANGGGTLDFPPGTYLCYSIHLKSNVCLHLDINATILAAENPMEPGAAGYDVPEPNDADCYEDFGHSHWHNSLIWGENLENVAITGLGRIDGSALSNGPNPRQKKGEPRVHVDPPPANRATTKFSYPGRDTLPPGIGNKAIALKLCRNVTFKDFTIFRGGHFGILITGVDNCTINNLKIDTNRDGMDLDCCRNVRVSDCSVNSPNDDGICPKSSYGLGEARVSENITITNCLVAGWEIGSMLDGTFKQRSTGPGIGRIKCGTESNAGFRNITVSNCVFDTCRGLALETVDGALLEDIAISNITMRNIGNSPIFLRLGSRVRGPEGTKTGELHRVKIDNVVCYGASSKYASIISGVPGHDIEDVTISNVRVYAKGGGTKEQAATQPAEKADGYPEPSMFGETGAYGFYIRHVKGIELRDVEVSYLNNDARPAFVLDDVKEVEFNHVKAQKSTGGITAAFKGIKGLILHHCPWIEDGKRDEVADEKL